MNDRKPMWIERVNSIADTRRRIEEKKAAKRARSQRKKQNLAQYLEYRAKLERERKALQEREGRSPYDIAVEKVARVTGVPASEWEWRLSHPYVRLANEAARAIAGLTRQPMGKAA